jgi:hypothetical protein
MSGLTSRIIGSTAETSRSTDAYKEHRKAQREREEGAITWIEEPRGIPVTVFHGWAPFREW